jgi:hypothetical protein
MVDFGVLASHFTFFSNNVWRDASGKKQTATLLVAQQRHPTLGIRWDYFLTVSAKDIPLTNRLLIDISLRRGTTHYELDAGLVQ